MDEQKLRQMSSVIDAKANEYVTVVTNSMKDLVESFNAVWVSNSAQKLAYEIGDVVNRLSDSIVKTFTAMNDAIAVNVRNNAMVEEENFTYTGFTFTKPVISAELAKTLAGGKVGLLEGTDVTALANPINKMIVQINGVLEDIVTAVKEADAFGVKEQEALVRAVEFAKSKFNEAMNELKTSLNERLVGEQTVREELSSTNASNYSL